MEFLSFTFKAQFKLRFISPLTLITLIIPESIHHPLGSCVILHRDIQLQSKTLTPTWPFTKPESSESLYASSAQCHSKGYCPKPHHFWNVIDEFIGSISMCYFTLRVRFSKNCYGFSSQLDMPLHLNIYQHSRVQEQLIHPEGIMGIFLSSPHFSFFFLGFTRLSALLNAHCNLISKNSQSIK